MSVDVSYWHQGQLTRFTWNGKPHTLWIPIMTVDLWGFFSWNFRTKVIKQSGPHISKKRTTVIRNSQPPQAAPRVPIPQPARPKPPSAPPSNFTKRPSPSYASQGHALSPHNPTSAKASSPGPISHHPSGQTTRTVGNPAVVALPYRYR